MSKSATVHAFPAPAGEVDLERLHACAGSLDFLAELVDSVVLEALVDVDPTLPEQLRSLADELIDLSYESAPDPLAVTQRLARSTDLMQQATQPICRSGTRRMLGGPLYDRVTPVAMSLGELAAVSFERMADDRSAMPLSVVPLRRFTRVAASAFDWAQWNVDVPARLRAPFVEAITNAAAAATEGVDISHETAPTDAAPLADALDVLHDAWLAIAPADVIAEFTAERDRNRALADCFDLGVALSIARRLLVTPIAPPPPDTTSIRTWYLAATATT